MPLLRLDGVSLAYGHLPLLARVDFQIEPGERVCLVGRNGAGKSTLLRVLKGAVLPDEGDIWRHNALRIAHLEQEVPPDSEETIYEVVAAGLGDLGELLTEYHQATQAAGVGECPSLQRIAELQVRIDALAGWNIEQKVQTVLTRLGLFADQCFARCSGGIRRQTMLARALVSEPDLLLLDEPTNHLDFDAYLSKKEELLGIETRAAANFDKKLAEEEAWIRQGIKARRTRNEGRVRALQAMRRQRSQRLGAPGQVRFGLDAGTLSGKLVVDLRGVSFAYGNDIIIRGLSTTILRGDRIGIIGPNGCGKTTLLKLILGEITPTSGKVVIGTRLKIAHFDQHRRELDLDKTVRENIRDGSDYVTMQGRSRHVIGYLRDFIFPPERIDSPIKALSGGERNRLLLAKIFTQSANMLVLDEPTNDLDVETLELLENLLADYQGTLLLVSHDRTFLDNVVTSTLVFEGEGKVGEYAGGYQDWELQRMAALPKEGAKITVPSPVVTTITEKTNDKHRKLSYKERRELEALPKKIEALEAEQSTLHGLMSDGDFYRQPGDKITAAIERSQAFYCGSDLVTRLAIKIPIAHQTMQRRLFCFQGLDFFRQCFQFAPFFVGEFTRLIVGLFRNCSHNRG